MMLRARSGARIGLLGAALAAGAAAGAPREAHAQRANEAAAAEALFDEGKRLMGSGQYATACPKFAESQRLDPGVGTMLWLGECHAKNGRIASAWATFKEAEALAAKQNDKRAAIARDEAQKLEPRLSRLVIEVPAQADVAGLVVARDGVSLGKPLWGTAMPTDAGPHHVKASAPNRTPWEGDVTVPADGGAVSIRIPPLARAPTPAAAPATTTTMPPPATDSTRGPWNTQRIVGAGVVGLGVVGAVVGVVLWRLAKSKLDASRQNCVGNVCNADGVGPRKDAVSLASTTTIVLVAAGVAVAGGAVLYLTAPTARGSSAVSVGAGPFAAAGGGGGAFVGGAFE